MFQIGYYLEFIFLLLICANFCWVGMVNSIITTNRLAKQNLRTDISHDVSCSSSLFWFPWSYQHLPGSISIWVIKYKKTLNKCLRWLYQMRRRVHWRSFQGVVCLNVTQHVEISSSQSITYWHMSAHKVKCSICILDHMQSTFFCLGKFLKWLADDQSSSITKDSIYFVKHYVHTTF